MKPRSVAILVFDDVELLDFCGPFEVFSSLDRAAQPPPFNVFAVAAESHKITAANGLCVVPAHDFATCPSVDILVVPGGIGTRREMNNETVVEWIRRVSEEAELTLSVCTGALLLARAGLLGGLRATTHHGAIDLLREVAPEAVVVAERRYVDNGRLVLSAGISAGMDMSLHVIARLHGTDAAERTARHMEYDWRREPEREDTSATGGSPRTLQ